VFEILLERAAEKDLRKLPEDVHARVLKAIQPLSRQPRPTGAKKLSGGKNDWRIRVGEYRVLYEIADTIRIVRIYRIRHRRDVYK
jgi:mRNA interferase RelE/StbE